ncbi:hypothetical protein FPZ42_09905 [Mucilaginibacter achroorhodeus]|uniref:Uncharacterized protein n=1 Tax=Mucilaginibacter achroorhodeus TaxID=2599294 RepID=A0A563U3M1_9SPHI|nr:MAC/perforin domain-containing protein [Mucilaginibacter achroorhodeus]TWR25944.1 hypothetical protein FPZ42_09905 [Mucilaginibacter achroorhodeus]
MKKTLLIIAALALLTSCEKNQNETKPINVAENLPKDITVIVNGTNEVKAPMYPWSEKYNFLGFGYDVTDKFQDEASVRASVVNMSAYDTGNPYRVDIGTNTEGSWNIIEAESAVDLSEKLSSSIEQTQGLKVFGNTIKDLFPNATVEDKKYVYGYYSNYWINKRYKFFYDQNVNNFLTAEFKCDALTLSAQALVAKYGTHVLNQIKIGSTFDVFYQAEAPELNRSNIVREGFRYALLKTFGLMSGFLDDINLKELNANKSVQIYYKSIGGDASKLKPQTINNKVIVNISEWRSTTTMDKSRFIGTFGNGLTSLDKFIDNSAKRDEVKLYIQQYIASKAVK